MAQVDAPSIGAYGLNDLVNSLEQISFDDI
jgi:hypothetical protein